MRWLLALFLALTAEAAVAADCKVTPGGPETVIRATVLAPAGPLRNTEVRVGADGTIACVGADCHFGHPQAARIDCPSAVLSPGFINDHEHINFAHIAPFPDTGERYGARQDWRRGFRGHQGKDPPLSRDSDILAWGELRHLLTGTTSMVGGGMAPGLVRNLDFHEGLEGLDTPRATNAIFPLDDLKGIEREGDCDYGPRPATTEMVAGLHAYVAHIAEGVDGVARNEFRCLSEPGFDTIPAPGGGGTSTDIILSNLAIVHGAALTPAMLAKVAARHASIVWSPRSNLSLYGATLDVATARRLGINLALGTDWLPSGSLSMGREAACALTYSREHLRGALTPRDLWTMMTVNAARAVHVETVVGKIRPGLAGDLILVRGKGGDPYGAVVSAGAPDMLAVMRGGKLLAGRADAMAARAAAGCETVTMGGEAHVLCLADDDGGRTYAALSAEMSQRQIWPAFFDGPPPVEPTCATAEPAPPKSSRPA